MSETITVTQALSAVMKEMPGIGKDRTAAPGQGGYAYRGIEDITVVTQTLFAKHGIVTSPHAELIANKDITVANKPWTDTILSVRYTVYGPSGDSIEAGPIIAIGRDNADKGANKAMTQAYKYLLLQLLCISDGQDDGDSASIPADAANDAHVVADASSRDQLLGRITIVKAEGHNLELLGWWKRQGLPILASLSEDQVKLIHNHLDTEGWAMDATEWNNRATAPKDDDAKFTEIAMDYDEWRKCFFAMLDDCKIDKDRRNEIVDEVTNHRASSTKDLTAAERFSILTMLEALRQGEPSPLADMVGVS